MSKLQTGDFVSFQTNLSLSIGLGASVPVLKPIVLSGATSAFVSGAFQVHVYKVSDTKVRVKLIALRANGQNVSGKASFVPAPLKVIGVSVADKKINKLIHFDPAQLSAGRNDSDVFLLDYVFDLKNPDAAKAYDNLMQRKTRFKSLELVGPFQDRQELENALVTDLSEIEELYQQDSKLAEDQRRIDRNFKGSQNSESVNANIKVGLNLLRLERNASFSESQILSIDENENASRYLFDSFQKTSTQSAFFNSINSSETISANLLFQADNQYRPDTFQALSLKPRCEGKISF